MENVRQELLLQGAVLDGGERLAVARDWRADAGYDHLRGQDFNGMTLEYLELMETIKKTQEMAGQTSATPSTTRRKLQKSFKSNTRIYDDGSIEVDPQAQGEPSQKDVKKVGKSKRYVTSGKNPLTCVELKCPDNVPDKAAFFHKELAKLTKDMEIEEPQLPESEYLLNEDCVKVRFSAKEKKVVAWLTFEAKGLIDVRRELYNLTSKIDKCFVINSDSICPQP